MFNLTMDIENKLNQNKTKLLALQWVRYGSKMLFEIQIQFIWRSISVQHCRYWTNDFKQLSFRLGQKFYQKLPIFVQNLNNYNDCNWTK